MTNLTTSLVLPKALIKSEPFAIPLIARPPPEANGIIKHPKSAPNAVQFQPFEGLAIISAISHIIKPISASVSKILPEESDAACSSIN